MAVFDAIKRAQEGNFKGGTDVVATVENGGVGIGKISAEGQKYADQVKEIQDQIAAGRDQGHPRHGPVSSRFRARCRSKRPRSSYAESRRGSARSSRTTGSTST